MNATVPVQNYDSVSLELLTLLMRELPHASRLEAIELLKKQTRCHEVELAEVVANGNAFLERVCNLSTQRDNFQMFLMVLGRICVEEDFTPSMPTLKRLDQFYQEFCGTAEKSLNEIIKEERQKLGLKTDP